MLPPLTIAMVPEFRWWRDQLRGDQHRWLADLSVGKLLDEPTPVVLEGVPDAAEPAPFGLQFVGVPYDVDEETAYAYEVDMPQPSRERSSCGPLGRSAPPSLAGRTTGSAAESLRR